MDQRGEWESPGVAGRLLKQECSNYKDVQFTFRVARFIVKHTFSRHCSTFPGPKETRNERGRGLNETRQERVGGASGGGQ